MKIPRPLTSFVLQAKKYFNPHGIILIYYRVNGLDVDSLCHA